MSMHTHFLVFEGFILRGQYVFLFQLKVKELFAASIRIISILLPHIWQLCEETMNLTS